MEVNETKCEKKILKKVLEGYKKTQVECKNKFDIAINKEMLSNNKSVSDLGNI